MRALQRGRKFSVAKRLLLVCSCYEARKPKGRVVDLSRQSAPVAVAFRAGMFCMCAIMFCMCTDECCWLLTLLKSRLSCLPEPWYPPWERKSLTCSWTCSSSRCQQFSSSTLAPAVGSGAPKHMQTHNRCVIDALGHCIITVSTVWYYCYRITSYYEITYCVFF